MIPYSLGSSLATLMNLQDLHVDYPKATPVDYPEYITLGNARARGIGSLQTLWRFTYITQEELAVIRTILPNTSDPCFIQTLERNSTYGIYSAISRFTEPENPKADYFNDYVIYFISLVKQP